MIRLKRLSESIDPVQEFTHCISVKRSEIAEAVSEITGDVVSANDDRLTEEFCQDWLTADIDFMKEIKSDDLVEKREEYTNALLKKSGFSPEDDDDDDDVESGINIGQ